VLTIAVCLVALAGVAATFQAGGYIVGKTAGTQEVMFGEYTVDLLESSIVHPSHTDGFVDINDPIVYNTSGDGGLIGVSRASASAATDYVAVAIDGLWNLSVVGSDDDGNSTVAIGDDIFINTSTAALSKIRNANTQRHFGKAFGAVTGGATTVIAVQLEPDPLQVATVVVGTSSARFTSAVADTNFIEYRYENSATSGDNRGIYNRLYLTGAGSGGESLRSFTTVEDVAAGTAHGAHVSLNFNDTGSVTGQGLATRSTLHVPNAALTGGTYAGAQSEVYHDGASSDISGTTAHSIHRFLNDGNATGQATMDYVFDFDGMSATQFPAATNSVIDHALKISVNGTDYWIGLYDSPT
jgi:hypothetical protein